MTKPKSGINQEVGAHAVKMWVSDEGDEDFMVRGECRKEENQGVQFFTENKKGQDVPLGICFKCPVQDECLVYAIKYKIKWGIWGGSLERDRTGQGKPAEARFNLEYCRIKVEQRRLQWEKMRQKKLDKEAAEVEKAELRKADALAARKNRERRARARKARDLLAAQEKEANQERFERARQANIEARQPCPKNHSKEKVSRLNSVWWVCYDCGGELYRAG